MRPLVRREKSSPIQNLDNLFNFRLLSFSRFSTALVKAAATSISSALLVLRSSFLGLDINSHKRNIRFHNFQF